MLHSLYLMITGKMASKHWTEWAAGALTMIIGSFFSPTLHLMTLVLKPYVDLKSLMASHHFIADYFAFVYRLKALSGQEFLVLLVSLALCFLVGMLYYAACTWFGVRLARYVANKAKPQAA